MLSIDELGAVVVDTMNLSSGDYQLTITGTYNNMDRSVIVPFTVDNDPDFEILTLDPWIVLPGGVEWVVPTPIFIEPVNGFGADVTVGVTVPNGVTAELDFARGFCSVYGNTDFDGTSQSFWRRLHSSRNRNFW